MASPLKNDLEELLNCAICLGTLLEPKLLPCSHRFCKPCIITLMDKSVIKRNSVSYFPCPLCKREISLGKGRTGEEWVVKFETDRLLKDIQDRLNKEEAKNNSLPYGNERCSNVQNSKAEEKRIKHDLQNYIEKGEKCIELIVAYVEKWASVRQSLKTKGDYSRRFEESFESMCRKYNSAVEELLQKYERYLQRSKASKRIEKEIRFLTESFPKIIPRQINVEDANICFQRKNEALIQRTSKNLQSVPNVNLLFSTVENIKDILDLSPEDIVLRGREVLADKTAVMIKKRCSNFAKQINRSSPRGTLTPKSEQIDLVIEKADRLLEDLNAALRNSKTPKKLMETTGWLCYPGGYKPQFEIEELLNSSVVPTVMERRNKALISQALNFGERVPLMCYLKDGNMCDSTHHNPDFVFCSYNSLKNRPNAEPFPQSVGIRKRVIPKPSHLGSFPAIFHHFENSDDEEEGRESERVIWEDIGDGLVIESTTKMTYEKKEMFPKNYGVCKVVMAIIGMAFIVVCIIYCMHIV